MGLELVDVQVGSASSRLIGLCGCGLPSTEVPLAGSVEGDTVVIACAMKIILCVQEKEQHNMISTITAYILDSQR